MVFPKVRMPGRHDRIGELDRRSVLRLGMTSALMSGATAALAGFATTKAFAAAPSLDQSSLPQDIKSQIRGPVAAEA